MYDKQKDGLGVSIIFLLSEVFQDFSEMHMSYIREA